MTYELNQTDDDCFDYTCKATYDKIIVIFLVVISIIIGFPLNGAATFLFFASWRKLSKHMINWLMLNMAVTNLATIILASVALIIEEFYLICDSSMIGKIFLNELSIESWKKVFLTLLNISFNVSMYSILILSVERWLIISGRRRKACSHELLSTACVLLLIWMGSIIHGLSRQRLFVESLLYQTLMAIILSDIIPCIGIGIFFVASARWLLYSYGASDDFSTKYLKARTRTARFLFVYVILLPILILPFTFVNILYVLPETRPYLSYDCFGRFLTNLSFVFDNCILQCLHPTLLFMLSSRYRQCVCDFFYRLRNKARDRREDEQNVPRQLFYA